MSDAKLMLMAKTIYKIEGGKPKYKGETPSERIHAIFEDLKYLQRKGQETILRSYEIVTSIYKEVDYGD